MCGVYVHFPFCQSKCGYCDFYSTTDWDEAALALYCNRVCEEARLAAAAYGRLDVATIYMGGGTPSLMPVCGVASIMDAICGSFSVAADAEITIEANPRTVSLNNLVEYKKLGVNRVSLGVQAAQDEILRAIGRRHTFADAASAAQMIRQAGFTNVSLDMMTALPNQSIADALETTDRLAELAPTHVSAYELTIAEGTPFASRYPSAPCPEDAAIEMMCAVHERLAAHGFARYEISNWCKPGCESRHNIGYWTRRDYLGLGAGAHSLVRDRRMCNPNDAARWAAAIAKGCLSYSDIDVIPPREAAFEQLMLGLRMIDGIPLTDELQEYFGAKVTELAADGLAALSNGTVRLTERGLWLHNAVCLRLLDDD